MLNAVIKYSVCHRGASANGMILSYRFLYRTAVLVPFLFFLFASFENFGQGTITGMTTPIAGKTYPYSLVDDIIYVNPGWSIDNGVVVASSRTANAPFTYSGNLTFNGPASTQNVNFWASGAILQTMPVPVVCPTVATPPVTFSYTYQCNSTTISMSPAAGTTDTWFWQADASSTNTTLGTASPRTVTTPGILYLRAQRNNAQGCWSAGYAQTIDVPINAVPAVPSVTVNQVWCSGNFVATPGANANTVKWYSSPTDPNPYVGTSFPAPASTGTYYLSSFNTTTGCESSQITRQLTVTKPGNPTVANANACGSGTITAVAGTDGQGVNWYTAPTGGTPYQSLTSPVTTVTTTYYVTTVGTLGGVSCESPSRLPVTLTIYPIPQITASGQIALTYGAPFPTLSTGSYFSYQWKRNNSDLSGAQQSSYAPVGSGSYTVGTTTISGGPVCVSPPVVVSNIIDQPVNVVSTTRILKEGVTAGTSLLSASFIPQDLAQTVTYQDGIGRTFQSVGVGLSPQKTDLVNPVGYGTQGLVDSTFLPYATAARDGRLRLNAIRTTAFNYTGSEQQAFYQSTSAVASDPKPYARSVHRGAPDARVIEQGAPGTDWQPGLHTVLNTQTLNAANSVRYWDNTGTTTQNYLAGKLNLSITTDENGNKVQTYTNMQGLTVLKQVQLDTIINSVNVPWLETYYVYDPFGRLKYQIPPKAVAAIGGATNFSVASNTATDELVYKYTYDSLGRVIEKKTPGTSLEYIVYDKLGRVVLTQDGNLRASNKWQFIKYDNLNRPVYSGLYQNTVQVTRKGVQLLVRNIDYATQPSFESRAVNSAYQGYTNTAFPTAGTTLLTANYYDTYDFDGNGPADYKYDSLHLTGQEGTSLRNTRGLPTGSKRVILDAAGNPTLNWLVNAVFYGAYDRPIQTLSNNHLYLTVADKKTIVYDFTKPLKSKTTHYQNATTFIHLTDRSDYDHTGRVLAVYRQINTDPEVLLVKYVYNALGQVVEKNLHCTNCNDPALNQPTTTVGGALQRTAYTSSEQVLLATQSITLSPGFYVSSGNTFNAKVVSSTAVEPGGGGAFMQSVDYRYNIRGWLNSINNAKLMDDHTTTNTNNDTNDYFGMELLYNTASTDTLGNKKYFNGNISAVKWKSLGSPDPTDRRSFKYSYDKSDKLMAASFQAHGAHSTGWTKEQSTLNERMTYDHNGNILTLNRNQNQRGLSGITVTSNPQTIDNLSYVFTTGNQLSKVDDTGTAAGFNNGSTAATEYTYNSTGSLTSDLNKGISAITYNFLAKPQQVTFTDGRVINYTYDAIGTKLTSAVTQSAVTATTAYVGPFVYQNNTLSFFSSPEGRVVKNGSKYEYQYAVTDHQGNTRVLFTSVAQTAQSVTATFETAAQTSEAANFQNYPSNSGINPVSTNNHTPGGTNSQYLNGGYMGKVGLAKSYHVFPGDVVKIEAYGKYSNLSATNSNLSGFVAPLLAAFNLAPPGVGEVGTAPAALNSWGVIEAGGFGDGSNNNTDPKAFVNIIIFDKNYNFLDFSYQQMTSASATAPTYMSATYTVKEAGYAYMYISNEHPTLVDVYFDDVKMSYTPSNVIQYNEYYPFGLQTANSWTRENTTGNNFLGNGGTELNTTSNLYDLEFRNYDPVLGRMHQVDPMADGYGSWSPYNFSFNDPVAFNDPNGASPLKPTSLESQTGWYINGPVTGGIMDTGTYGGYGGGDRTSVANFLQNGLYGTISQWNPNLYGPSYDSQSKQYGLAELKDGAWGYWFNRNSIEYEYSVDKNGNLIKSGSVVVRSTFISQTQGGGSDDCPCWAAGGRAFVRAFVPFGNDIYPDSEEPGYDPSKKPIIAVMPDLPIGPSGAAKGAKVSYTVYKAIAKNGNVYWGMTKNFAQRVAQHGNRFVSITEEYINIGSKGAARGLEQLKIDAAGGIRNLENAINSIGPNNPKLIQYYQDAIRYLNGL